MNIEQMHCCALNEISYLGNHRSPKSAMEALCKKSFRRQTYNYYSGRYTPTAEKVDYLQNHYIFTGIVGYKRGVRKPQYAQNFAAFIKDNDLGVIIEGEERVNRKNNPTHIIKAYLWHPNVDNVKKWFEDNATNDELVKKAKAARALKKAKKLLAAKEINKLTISCDEMTKGAI